ncbi:MAG: energy-coupling factor transporter transmembrane component T, partial [Eubacteriales bacterium]|nr:energy-coupling factor transporter transmembrane component T [Eubacteriales bacterium]
MNKIDSTIHGFFTLEEMAAERSAFHAMHPGLKLILTFVYVAVVISSPRYAVSSLCIFFFYPAVVISLAGIRLEPLMKRLLLALPFVVFAGISNIIFDRQIVLTLFGVGISAGVISCIVLILKTMLCVGAVMILAATTPSIDIFSQLRRFRVPKVLVVTIMLCFRYLVLLLHEARQMSIAYHLRSPKQKGIDIRHMGSFIGQLLLR